MLLHSIALDLRYGARTLLRNPGFTAVSVLALALGIGLNTVAFTAYKTIIARPLDARDPSTMVNFALRLQSGAESAIFSYPDYEAYRDRLQSFRGVIAVSIEEMRLTGAGGIVGGRRSEAGSLVGGPGRLGSNDMETVTTFMVSDNYFSVLGVTAKQGLTFESIPPTELTRSPPVLISENYWQSRFGGDPAIIGKTMQLNGAAFTVVGITPHNFVGTSYVVPNFWLPLSLYRSIHPASKRLEDRDDLFCRIFGRLAPGVSMRQAEAETSLLVSQLRSLHGSQSELSKEVTALISPGSPMPGIKNAGLRVTILLIMVGVGMVMAIACANVAGLQLARATTRQRELGVRMALGASRLRLIQQLLTESALLGFLAGCVALPATWALLHVAVTKIAEVLPAEFTLVLNVRPDLQVFGYVFAISFVAGILSGLAPAIESSGSALASIVRGVGISSVRGHRLRNGLIIAQVSVSLALMIAGGMLIRSAINTLNLKTGYDSDHVITLRLEFPDQSKFSGDRKATLVQELRTRLSALPGVVGITSSRAPTDNGGRRAAVSLDGSQPSVRNRHALLYYTWIQANYFQTLGVPMLLGQGFQSRSGEPERLAILSESAARRLWPGQNPLGGRLRLGTDEQFHNQGELLPDGPVWLVVGVARDTRGVTVDGSDSQQIYLPLPDDRIADYPILVRTNSDPRSVIRAMGPVISAVDPDLAASVSTLQDTLSRTDAFIITITCAAIASAISLFGLILVSMGIYSTISYIVVLRTREIGVRMAVGAQKRDILIQVIRESLRPVVVGLVIGMLFAVGGSLLLRRVLYGVSTIDAVSFVGASLFFLAIALVASCPPAWRAMGVDPIVALRYE